MSTEVRPIQKAPIAMSDALKVIRLNVQAGATIPEHHSNVDVVVTVVRGAGRFLLAGTPRAISGGEVIVMKPGERHAIEADEDLELIVVHARLVHADAPATCGA